MNRTTLLFLFLFASFFAQAQSRFAVEAGVGKPAFGFHPLQSIDVSHDADNTGAFEISYLRMVSSRSYFGVKLLYQQYSFRHGNEDIGASHGDLYEIRMRASYLFVAPTLDVGLGLRKRIHYYLSPSLGIRLDGTETIHHTLYFTQAPSNNIDETHSSSNNISNAVVHLNMGFEEHFKLNAQWHIVVNAGMSFISSGMTSVNGRNISPGYYYMQLGVMKKHHKMKEQVQETPTKEKTGKGSG